MEKLTLRELATPIIKAIDSINYLLKSHHRHTAVIAYSIGKHIGLDDHQLCDLVIAAALHDIGALSVRERDGLIQHDVENPGPHCQMGYRMLVNFDAFQPVAQIIKHHHIMYRDLQIYPEGEVPFQSLILHLSDRVDVYTNPNYPILDQKRTIIDEIIQKSGIDFDPALVEAFVEVSKPDIFWINIGYMSIDDLFQLIHFYSDYELNLDKILEFSMTISRIIDFRSSFTASHSNTVAQLAGKIGEYLNFNQEMQTKLKIAGYLHDIGKIGIDPGLIEKPGKLSNSEYNEVRMHSYLTGQILNELSRSEWFQDIVTWAKLHHERIDGSGYPFGYHGDQIDDGVIIMGFADVLSALMEDRPYRAPMPTQEAFQLIENQIAPKLSVEMFETIKSHQQEIEEIVQASQKSCKQEYHQSL
ncbi:MAG: HD-GYP domain-containing protein [Candidatus Izemoplasmatales bacterium]